jgi:hypothetical protein
MKAKEAALYMRNEIPWILQAKHLEWGRVAVWYDPAVRPSNKEVNDMLETYSAYIADVIKTANDGPAGYILAPMGREYVNPHRASFHRRQISLKLSPETDKDIMEKLDGLENVQGYIKSLIRHDLVYHDPEDFEDDYN